MLLFFKDQLVLLWMITVWFGIKAAYSSEVLPYGERLRPLKGLVTKIKPNPQLLSTLLCESCNNKTTTKNRNESPLKIEKRIDANPLIVNIHHVNPLEKTQQTASPIYSGVPKENINNRGATFFFTQVEPHRYEYRAMFQHHRDNYQHREIFQPFVHNFNPFSRDFPPLPKFPNFQEFPQIFNDHKNTFPHFQDHKDPFPNFPDHKTRFKHFHDQKDPFPGFPEFTFPTLSPEIKRIWEPSSDIEPEIPVIKKDFDVPLVKDYDVILGHKRYPKIFQFNEERINIEEFDREKKLRLYKLSKGNDNVIEPENVKRDNLLILHGGIFTVQEPPLYNKRVKKIRKSRIFGTKIS